MIIPKLVNDSRRAGLQLAEAFHRGAELQPVPTRIALNSGEICVGSMDVRLEQYFETDAQWVHKSGGYYGGGLIGLAALGTATAVGNSSRKINALRAAAARWRPVDQGRCYFTNQRFAIQGRLAWIDFWYGDIRMADCDGYSIQLHFAGGAPNRLVMAYVDYWFVMFNKAAYDRVVWPPLPDDQPPPGRHAGPPQVDPRQQHRHPQAAISPPSDPGPE